MSFDRLAPHYCWLEGVLAGRVLQRARLVFLPALDRAAHVLLVGEGPGRFLSALRARRPDVRVTVLDSSAAMLRESRRRDPSSRTEFIHADLRDWRAPPHTFDAIVTCCVLDCFQPGTLATVIERLSAAAQPTADWLQVDFTIPRRGWRRARARVIHALMYMTFRALTHIEARAVTPPGSWLRQAGFVRRSTRTFSAGLLLAEHWVRRVDAAPTATPCASRDLAVPRRTVPPSEFELSGVQ